MERTVKKAIKTGYGLGLLSMKEAKKVAGKVKKELALSEKESMKLAKELVANSAKASKEVLGTAGKFFESALCKSGVASKSEIRIMKKMVGKRVQRLRPKKKKASVFCRVKRKIKKKVGRKK